MMGLPAKIVAIHEALDDAGLPHAFGGALALAWCTERARGTIDIDLNVFVDNALAVGVLEALPDEIVWSDADLSFVERDGQARLWWDTTPVDLFMNTTEFHVEAAERARQEDFAGVLIPFLACADLAVFKAFLNRTKDWADLEEMAAAATLDLDRVIGVLVRYLGPGDERIERLRALDHRI
jgi:predicted nucleotidyltransferase